MSVLVAYRLGADSCTWIDREDDSLIFCKWNQFLEVNPQF